MTNTVIMPPITQRELAAAIATHKKRLGVDVHYHCGPDCAAGILAAFSEHVEAKARDAEGTRARIVELIRDRRDDQRSCNKDDDCHTRADALDVVLADIEYELSRGSSGLRSAATPLLEEERNTLRHGLVAKLAYPEDERGDGVSEPTFSGQPGVWVPIRSWRVGGGECRQKGCERMAIAELDRWHVSRRNVARWAGWCDLHLGPYYRVNGDVVECLVGPGSPAAEQGWTT